MGAAQSTTIPTNSKVITILNIDRCKKVGCRNRALFNEHHCETHLRIKQSCCGIFYSQNG